MNRNQYSVSAAQPGLSVSVISALKVPVPPFEEQNAIATFLERETSKIDQLAAKIESAINRLQEYRTALITATVTVTGKIDVRAEAGESSRTNMDHKPTRTSTDGQRRTGNHGE
jgi:type I restriction enzyme S subunit